ncbi:MAG: hypothetical protein MZV63_02690 [Marinilabiliales bacterium]|nr:hypothetical protein [Marinilabiliales bacterium]
MKFNMISHKPEFFKLTGGITNIEDICVSEDGFLWIATLGSGVCRFDPVTGDKSFYTTASGLTNNTTYSVMPDLKGKHLGINQQRHFGNQSGQRTDKIVRRK